MIYKIISDQDIRKTNDNIDAVPEFLKCNDKLLKYIFLMNDYDSPYARLPILMRKDQVLVSIGFIKEGTISGFFSRHKENLSLGTRAFNKIQYNSDFEALISLKIQIDQWNDLLRKTEKTDKEMAISQKIFDKMPEYIKRVKELEEIVGYRDDLKNDDDEQEKTTLEIYLDAKWRKQQEEE